MRNLILVLMLLGLAFILFACNGVPPKIQVAIDGNMKDAQNFQKFYTDLINCENQADLDKLWKWAVENCPSVDNPAEGTLKCKTIAEEKAHKKARLATNLARAQKLSKWAKDAEKED